MIFEYINFDNTREIIELDLDVDVKDEWVNISTKDKREFIKEFLPAYSSGQKLVLFDSNHKELLKFYKKNDINTLEKIDEVNHDAKLLFFTSGSSGFPVGAFKSEENIQAEVAVLKELVLKRDIKKVVVTVPFVHIYGVLAGLLLPLSLGGVKLVVKDDFLPYEVLSEAKEPNTLVVTTPVFIKALSKLSDEESLASSLFICSTGPLHVDDVEALEVKYDTTVMQLFGSTETGGIAHKFSTSSKWVPLQSVEVKSKEDKLSVSSKFISPYIIDKEIKKLSQPFTTEDIIELDDEGFTLVGRSNKIIKIAGKRISAIHIEAILETIPEIKRAVVELVYKKELLRSEQIIITIQADDKIPKSTIKKKIVECYGVLTIPFSVKYVQSIDLSAMGKKIIFN